MLCNVFVYQSFCIVLNTVIWRDVWIYFIEFGAVVCQLVIQIFWRLYGEMCCEWHLINDHSGLDREVDDGMLLLQQRMSTTLHHYCAA